MSEIINDFLLTAFHLFHKVRNVVSHYFPILRKRKIAPLSFQNGWFTQAMIGTTALASVCSESHLFVFEVPIKASHSRPFHIQIKRCIKICLGIINKCIHKYIQMHNNILYNSNKKNNLVLKTGVFRTFRTSGKLPKLFSYQLFRYQASVLRHINK